MFSNNFFPNFFFVLAETPIPAGTDQYKWYVLEEYWYRFNGQYDIFFRYSQYWYDIDFLFGGTNSNY